MSRLAALAVCSLGLWAQEALWVPRNLDPAKKYPLLISLQEGDVRPNRRGPTDSGFIVASPRGTGENAVYALLSDLKQRFPIDEDRVYLSGIAEGGGTALLVALTRPDLWAAVALICPIPSTGTADLIGNARNLRVKLFQGEYDPIVKPEQTRQLARDLTSAGARAEYVEYPRVRHNAWENAYKDGAIFDWLRQQQRQRFPEHIHFATSRYRFSEAYWVKIDELTPGAPSVIDVAFENRTTLAITTSGLDAFTLNVKAHPVTAVRLDGAMLKVRPANTLSFTKSAKGWFLHHTLPSPTDKREGQEGPIRDAIDARHLYVYGTGGSPSSDELIQRRDDALHAADWSTPRHPAQGHFAVIADDEVKDSDLQTANLILFGTKETNSCIARLASGLPFSLSPSAADYGMVLLAPLGEHHYAVVNSGLPWWTHGDVARRTGLPISPAAFQILGTFQDYIVFRGGLDHVLAEGSFDRNWKLPPDARAALRAIPAIAVR